MKILHIINSLNTGGAEKLVLETVPLYVKQGITVDVLVLNGTNYPFLAELKKKECCNIISLGTTTVYNPLLIFKMMPFLKNYTMVHVHLFPAQYWVIMAKLLSFSKVPLVFTEHSTNNRRINNYFLKFLDKFVYRFYIKTVCISEEIQQLLEKHTSLPSSRFMHIANGINTHQFMFATAYAKTQLGLPMIAQDDVLFIQVSSLKKPKDQHTLIKSLTHLPSRVKLLLVGHGVQQEPLQQLVKKLQLEERVHFLGVRTDVPQLLKTADIVVLSSHYEGLSLSSVEGMASGKPFIASNVPGLKDVVQGAGILFECGNHLELATIIQQLIDDKNYYNEIATKCVARSKEYDIATMVEKHISLYKSLVFE